MKISREEPLRALFTSLLGIGWAAFGFAAVMSVLVIATAIQLKRSAPLDSPALAALYGRLRDNPEDERLKAEIRGLDLLARRAYFTSRSQVASGGVLVLAGAATAALAWAAREAFRKKIPASPKGKPLPAPVPSRLLARRLVIAGGAALMAFALAFAFLIAPWWDSSLGEEARGTAAGPQSGDGGGALTGDGPMPESVVAGWPNFRGPSGRSLASGGGYPVSWDGASGEGILWKQRLTLPGFNSPVVSGGRVFLSGATKTGAEIYAFEAGTGKPVFTAKIAFSPEGRKAKVDEENVGFAAGTLAADEKRVAAVFAGGDAVCLSHDGKVLWQKHLGLPELNYGYSSSPIVLDGLLLVQFDHRNGARLIALDLETGEARWEKSREVLSSWASPAPGRVRGRAAVITASNPFLMAHDAATGEELWSVDYFTGEIGSSPVFADGFIVAGNDPGRLSAFTADDGKILWEVYDDLPNVSSPLIVDGLVFFASSAGAVTCLDLPSGQVFWRQEFTDGFYATPVAAGGNLYLLDREGVTHIVAARKEYSHTGGSALGEPADASPAFADGRIFIRGRKNLYCIGK